MRKIRLRRFITVAMTVFLAVTLVACEKPKSESVATEDAPLAPADGSVSQTVAIGIQANPQFMPIYVCKEKGYITDALAELNVSVVWNEYNTAIPLNRSLNNNNCQIGFSGDVATVLGIDTYGKTEIIGTSCRCPGLYSIVVPKASAIASAADLVGKSVGTVYGSTCHEMLAVYMENAGYSIDDISVVDVSVGDISSYLSSGEVDAVAIWDPHAIRMQNSKIGRVLVRGSDIEGFNSVTAVVARQDFAAAHPEICKVILEQYQRAANEILTMDADDVDMWDNIASDMSINDDQLSKLKPQYDFSSVSVTDEDIAAYQSSVEMLFSLDIIDAEFDVREFVAVP